MDSQEVFHAAFDHAAIGMALVAPDGRVLRVNAALCALIGYDEHELLGMSFLDFTHPEDRDADRVLAARLFEGDIPRYQLEKRYVCKDGAIVWVNLHGALVRDASGLVRFAIGQVEDITSRKRAEFEQARAEASLRASEERLRVLIDQLPAVVYLTASDEPYTPLSISPEVDALLGPGAREAYLNGRWYERIHAEDVAAVYAEYHRARADSPWFRVEYRFLHDDHHYVWLRDEARRVFNADGESVAWQGLLFDVTRERDMLASLATALAAAEESNRLKSAFLSTMSHELRTPMTAIIGYTSLLLEDARRPLDPDQRMDLEQIATSGERLLGLINDVLDLSRIEAGGIKLAHERIDIETMLGDVWEELEPLAGAKGLAIRITTAPILPELHGDPLRVRQILLNLLGNAVKFTERGTIEVRADADAASVRVAVQDTGIGIAPGVVPHVFEEFQQADPSTTRRYGGSGLGLAISRRLANLHGGTIEVESTLGVGSRFTLVLPREPDPDDAVNRHE